ncbi:MAG: DMT family transporter [Pseudomonadota bacterium]
MAGYLFILYSSLALGIGPAFTKLSFGHGVDLSLSLASRYCLGITLVFFLVSQRQVLRDLFTPKSLILAVGYNLVGSFYIASYLFIPVTASVVFFFTFPLLTTLVHALVTRTRVPWLTWGMLICAFIGIVLVVQGAAVALNPVGVALALGAAVANAVVITFVGPTLEKTGTLPFIALASVMGAPFFLAWAIMTQDFGTVSGAGWLFNAFVALFFISGISAYYKAIDRLGPVEAAIFANLEPVVGLVMGVVLVGEFFGRLQLLGAVMVIAALAIHVLYKARA